MADEKQYENKIKKAIKSVGGWEVKFFANAFTQKGIPDVLACVNGMFLAVEVKAATGKPSDLQIHHLKAIHRAGGYGVLLYPEDYETFHDMLCYMAKGEHWKSDRLHEILKERIKYYEKSTDEN